MKLSSFRIINCLGFNDSEVKLLDSNNLIYILGRNSSGKSSLLNAINYFEHGKLPAEMKNYENFIKTEDPPRFIAQFLLEEGDLSFDSFYKLFLRELDNIDIPESFLDLSPLLESINGITGIYKNLIEELHLEKQVEIHKFSDGSYHFIQKDFSKYKTRINNIEKLINETESEKNVFTIAGNRFIHSFRSTTFENYLFIQFPQIYFFNEEHPLNESLSNIIAPNQKANNDFERHFVEYLGEESIRRWLLTNDPRERDKYKIELNEKVNSLTDRVNKSSFGSDSLDQIEIYLDIAHKGLQITLYTDGKPSFYSHLSDNTRFLFAYHLYTEIKDINNNILLFDEPNNGFHPTAQKKMLNFLKELGERGNQVIVSTHSEYLIDPDHLSGVRLMSRDDNNYTTVKNNIYEPSSKKGDYQALQPIWDAIGYKYGNQLEVENKVIITEGITDLLYLRAFNKILETNVSLNIAPSRGDGKIPHLISFIISQGLSFKILIDTGEIKSHIQTDFGISDDFIFEVPIPDSFTGKTDGSGIEDLLSKNDFKNLLEKIGHKPTRQFEKRSNSSYMNCGDIEPGAKRMVASYLYENVNSFSKTDFEDLTLKNFTDLLDFCANDNWFYL